MKVAALSSVDQCSGWNWESGLNSDQKKKKKLLFGAPFPIGIEIRACGIYFFY